MSDEEKDTPEEQAEETVTQHIDKKLEKQSLRVPLTDPELLKHGEEMAEAQQEVEDLTEEMKDQAKDFKNKIKDHETRIARLGRFLRERYELRDVEVEVVHDFDAGTITTTRLDTNEVVEERKMNPAEAQRKMKLWPEDGSVPSDDENYEPEVGHGELHHAIRIIQERKRAAVTVLQRGMGISDRRAWMIIEKLEEIGVVGPPVGEGEPREILKDEVTLQRFLEDYEERADEHEKEQVLNSLMADTKEAVETADVEE